MRFNVLRLTLECLFTERPAVFQRPRRGDLLLGQHTGYLGRTVPGKAKGKRLTTFKIDSIEELEPTRFPEPPSEDNDEEQDGSDSENEGENLDPDAGKSEQQVIDELTGQTNLFSEKDFEEDQKDKDWLSKQ